MSRPKILLGITADISFRLLEGFPEYLVSQGWDVHVVSSPGPSLTRLGMLDGITAHSLPMVRTPMPLKDIIALVRWVRLLKRIRPDLISAGTPKAGLLGSVAGAIARVPQRIYLLRGLRLETASGLLFIVLRFAEKIAVAAATQVVAVSPSLRAKALSLNIVSPDKIVVIGRGSSNGVDVAAFESGNFPVTQIRRLSDGLGLLAGVPVLGFVGRLTIDKGLGVLAQSRAILSRNGIAHQLLVIGSADSSPVDGQIGLDPQLPAATYTGHVNDPEKYFQLIDVLCLPTFREGFPNVVLEAGAARVPTVTTTATGAVDSVVDGQTGLISVVGSPASLAQCLATLLVDPALRSRMGEAAHSHVIAHFSRTTVWSSTEQFYRNCVLRGLPNGESQG